jgi:hypothetical protein
MIHTYREGNETGKNLQHQKRIYHHFGFHKKGAPRRAPLANVELRLGGADVVRPRSLLALLDVEADGLATTQAVEVQ